MASVKKWFVRGGVALLILNEIRGLVMAGPALYGAWIAMGDTAALFLALCGLGGVIASVVVPLLVVRWVRRGSVDDRHLPAASR